MIADESTCHTANYDAPAPPMTAPLLSQDTKRIVLWIVVAAAQFAVILALAPVLTPFLVVVFALLAFGQLFGFFGVLLALPTCAVLLVGASQLRRVYLASDLYWH